MSTTSPQLRNGRRSVAVQELNITNTEGDHYDMRTTYHNTAVTTKSGSHIEPLDRLLGHVAHGAVHDSAERGPHAPKCHPETRTAVQLDIMSWIQSGERDGTPKRILWLSGPAGSGKTAIAGTIADECYKGGFLAASFFFSAFAGSRNRRWKKPFIPTLVYRLIQHEPIIGLKKAVLRVIKRDPMVFERHLDQQLEELVLKPLRKVAGRSNPQQWPAVIIVDGLDECQGDGESSGPDSQKEVLSALSRACTDPAFPFRIIIASRPEPVIRHFFAASPSPILRFFLDDKYDPDSDIRLFLEAMFSDIRRRFNLPSSWASKDVVDLLVTEASGQFIYATTVVRFLDSPHLGAPQQQLNRVLEWRRLDNTEAFAPLDRLYDRILRTSPEPLLAVKWLRFIDDCSWRDAVYLRCVLESYIGETEHVLGTLTSLIGLGDDNSGGRFHFYHKSLLDFLGDPHRSSDLHMDDENVRRFVKDRYYQFLLARGPQSNATSFPLVSRSSDVFCNQLCKNIDPRRKYTPENVEWWLANLSANRPSNNIHDMLHSVHKECKWYRCLPACRVWRKGILKFYQQHGWREPMAMGMLRNRFKKRKGQV